MTGMSKGRMTGMSKGGWGARPVVAARAGLLALVLLAPVAALAGHRAGGRDAAVGALVGLSVPAVVLLLTWGAVELAAERPPSTYAGLLMASYLVKLVAVLALLAVIDRADLASPVAAGVAAVVGLLAALVVEALVVLRTRAPYVEP